MKYSNELNTRILIALLKKHGIKRVILNPGSSNLAFSGSVQNDGDFELYSGVDERHSAYMACGIAAETGEPVVINCTGATSSRNYMPALTEAFYRKLPILVVTSSQPSSLVGQLEPQVTNRLVLPQDVVRHSVNIRAVTELGTGVCQRLINEAILELWRHGGGPVHLNLEMSYSHSFDVGSLPEVAKICRYGLEDDDWPEISRSEKVAVFIGSHKIFPQNTLCTIREFVERHNAVVLCDCTSAYEGPKKIFPSLICSQKLKGSREFEELKPSLTIHIGEISGDAPTTSFLRESKCVWRVSEDGEIRDTFGKLKKVFEMSECAFFSHYNQMDSKADSSYYELWRYVDGDLRSKIPELPFSNPFMAQRMSDCLPSGSILHLAILNSLRGFNYFGKPSSVSSMSNVGGFGIDGCTSTLIGVSLVRKERLCFLVTGDLAFFYDLNAIGNRHIGSNLRILLVNNGGGAEFHMYNNPTSQFAERTGDYIAADGHFGRQSKELLKGFAEQLGFDYMTADSKEQFDAALPRFVGAQQKKPILLECFTTMAAESSALELLNGIRSCVDVIGGMKRIVPSGVKSVVRKLLK